MNDARQLDAEKAARHAAYVEENCFDRQGQGHLDIGVVGPVGTLFSLGLEEAFAARGTVVIDLAADDRSVPPVSLLQTVAPQI